MDYPTQHPEVNHLLQKLLEEAQIILNSNFLGMYLFGSLASGDFDQDSDIDVVIITVDEISDNHFSALKRCMSASIPCLHLVPFNWRSPKSRHRPSTSLILPIPCLHPHIDRGCDNLFLMQHNEDWIVQQISLSERALSVRSCSTISIPSPIKAENSEP